MCKTKCSGLHLSFVFSQQQNGKMPVPLILKLSNISRVSTWMGDRLGKPQCSLSVSSKRNCAGAFLELVSARAKAPPLVSDRIVEMCRNVSEMCHSRSGLGTLRCELSKQPVLPYYCVYLCIYLLVLTTLCKKNLPYFQIYTSMSEASCCTQKSCFYLHKGILARLDLRNIKTSKCHQHQGTVLEEEQNYTRRLYC